MKMKKINVKDYNIEVNTPEGKRKVPYDVVTSIENVVLATGPMTSQKLSMPQLLEASRVCEKIKDQKNKGFALLEDSEFKVVKQGFDAFSGFGLNEVELCKRIAEVETIEVEEKEKKKK